MTMTINEALVRSVKDRKYDAFYYLASLGADLTFADADGRTVLHHILLNIALMDEPKEEYTHLRWMMNQRVNLTAADARGYTPLHLAASLPNNLFLEVATPMLAADAQVHAFSLDGLTPLHMAGGGDAENFAALVRLGADANWVPDAPGENYLTPLQNAVRWGRADIVRPYVEAGMLDVRARTLDGQSLADLAGQSNAAEMRALIFPLITESQIQDAMQTDATNEPVLARRPAGLSML